MSETHHYFAYRLVPPRSTFPADMSSDEAAAMAAHMEYWTGLRDAGTAVVFGAVFDPAGVWGLAVIDVAGADDEEAAAAAALGVRDGDPAVARGVTTAEIHPMPGAVVRPMPVPCAG